VKALKAVSATRVICSIIVAVVPTVSTSVNERQRINVSDTHSTPGVQAKI